MRHLLSALFLTILTLSAHAETVPYSQTFQFTGTCTGDDMWNSWKVGSLPKTEGALIRPWADRPINVFGYELIKLSPTGGSGKPDTSWFMVGSTIQADAVLWLAPGENHAKVMWPAGLSQPFPSRKAAPPLEYHRDATGKTRSVTGPLLDLHGHCAAGDVANLMLTVYFTYADGPSETGSVAR